MEKPDLSKKAAPIFHQPYQDSATNFIYNLLFCDDLNLYRENTAQPFTYPFDVLFAETSSVEDLQKIIDDADAEPRIKMLSYNKLALMGQSPHKKELLGVIVEVGLEEGLDVLASFENGTARYINHTERMIVWENIDDAEVNQLTKDLFANSRNIVDQIGAWDQARRPAPVKGDLRISFLVSDGLYFGEGPTNVLFNDAMAAPALLKATELMRCLMQRDLG